MQKELDSIIMVICEKDSRYREDAYAFVLESLAFTQKKFKRPKHVTGPELLEGISELLMEQYGPMALSVLKHWGIKGTEDFGNIVFNLLENKVLSKTDEDRMDDFKNVFDFDVVFDKGYRNKLNRKISRLR
jgi:uncharacterized repeat protein (TIGR04138 family)